MRKFTNLNNQIEVANMSAFNRLVGATQSNILYSKQYFSVSQKVHRFVMSSKSKTEELEALKSNPYYEKYSTKISKLQKVSPELFLSKLEHVQMKAKPEPAVMDDRPYSSIAYPKPVRDSTSSTLLTKPKLLNDIMKVDLIKNRSVEEIEQIWEEYHKHKDVITATIPLKTYELIFERSHIYPVFLFPLPRDKGYEFILCQFSGQEAHFTPLINYQTHKENAPECLTMIHFTDLKDKEIILMKGEYNKDVINGQEAQCLANQLQLYYGQSDYKKLNIMKRFTNSPDDFKFIDLIAELECLTL